jgi:hypothetical protein
MDNVRITIIATSVKNSPILPSRKKKVLKAIIVVKMAEVMAGITSLVPSSAADIGSLPDR